MNFDELFNKSPDDPRLEAHEREIIRKKALLEKVKVMRDSTLLNRGAVKGKPDIAYMWVNVREERQVYFKTLGWELCTDPEVTTNFKQSDGTHRRGDLILYQIDKETAEVMHLYDVIRGIEMVEGHQADFESTLARVGAPIYRPPVA